MAAFEEEVPAFFAVLAALLAGRLLAHLVLQEVHFLSDALEQAFEVLDLPSLYAVDVVGADRSLRPPRFEEATLLELGHLPVSEEELRQLVGSEVTSSSSASHRES